MLHKPPPTPLISISTRVFPETHESLRRLQEASEQSLPVVLRTIVRHYEKNLLRWCTAEERAEYLSDALERDALRAITKRSREKRTMSNGFAGNDWRDK